MKKTEAARVYLNVAGRSSFWDYLLLVFVVCETVCLCVMFWFYIRFFRHKQKCQSIKIGQIEERIIQASTSLYWISLVFFSAVTWLWSEFLLATRIEEMVVRSPITGFFVRFAMEYILGRMLFISLLAGRMYCFWIYGGGNKWHWWPFGPIGAQSQLFQSVFVFYLLPLVYFFISCTYVPVYGMFMANGILISEILWSTRVWFYYDMLISLVLCVLFGVIAFLTYRIFPSFHNITRTGWCGCVFFLLQLLQYTGIVASATWFSFVVTELSCFAVGPYVVLVCLKLVAEVYWEIGTTGAVDKLEAEEIKTLSDNQKRTAVSLSHPVNSEELVVEGGEGERMLQRMEPKFFLEKNRLATYCMFRNPPKRTEKAMLDSENIGMFLKNNGLEKLFPPEKRPGSLDNEAMQLKHTIQKHTEEGRLSEKAAE